MFCSDFEWTEHCCTMYIMLAIGIDSKFNDFENDGKLLVRMQIIAFKYINTSSDLHLRLNINALL